MSRPIARSGARSSIRGSLAVRAASASSPSSRPGAIAPPTYAPSPADAVEGGGGAEVDDDRRRPVQPGGGQGVDQPVGPDLARPVHADRDRDGAGAGDEQRPLVPRRRRPPARRSGRHDGRQRDRRRRRRAAMPSRRSRPSSRSSSSSAWRAGRVAARRVASSAPARNRPSVTFVLPMSSARSMAPMIRGPRRPPAAHRPLARARHFGSSRQPRCGTIAPVRPLPPHRGDAGCPASRPRSSSSTRASSRAGRTCSTCSGRCSSRRSRTAICAAASSSSHGTGWVERIVVDQPDVSTYFTPLAITLNIDSFEHLEFETRPDQLLVYTLVQGDERVVVEFAPDRTGRAGRLALRAAPARVRHQRVRPDGAARPRSPRGRVARSGGPDGGPARSGSVRPSRERSHGPVSRASRARRQGPARSSGRGGRDAGER